MLFREITATKDNPAYLAQVEEGKANRFVGVGEQILITGNIRQASPFIGVSTIHAICRSALRVALR